MLPAVYFRGRSDPDKFWRGFVAAGRRSKARMNPMRPCTIAVFLIFLSAGLMFGQSDTPAVSETGARTLAAIPLEVPAGTPLPVVLDKEVRIQKSGQPIHGKIAEPVYAFDRLVVPAGSEVTGSVTRIAGVPAMKRTMAALDANFSPTREVEINFDQLVLPDGRRVPLHTQVSPASQGVLQFATETKNQNKENKDNAAKKLAARKASETKKEISREWDAAK